MPPDLGIALPNSSMTKMPHVEMIAPMTQHISAMPTLPESLKMVLGVEKMLHKLVTRSLVLGVLHIPCANDLVDNQRHSTEKANGPLLQNVDLDNAKLDILVGILGAIAQRTSCWCSCVKCVRVGYSVGRGAFCFLPSMLSCLVAIFSF